MTLVISFALAKQEAIGMIFKKDQELLTRKTELHLALDNSFLQVSL